MYDNVSSLRFDTGNNGENVAGAMVSAEKEVMEFRSPIPTEGRVEEWMTAVLIEMRRSNRLITKEAVYKYCEDRSRYDFTCFSWNYSRLFSSSPLWISVYESLFKMTFHVKNCFKTCQRVQVNKFLQHFWHAKRRVSNFWTTFFGNFTRVLENWKKALF